MVYVECKYCLVSTHYLENNEDRSGYWWCGICGSVGYFRPGKETHWFAPKNPPPDVSKKEYDITKSCLDALKAIK